MADDVQISVGVNLAGLQSSIESAKAQFEEMKAAVVGLMAAGGLTAMVVALSELGEQAERAAAMLGISTESAQALGIIAQVSGGSLEGITSQLVRLQVGMERGEKSTSIQAAALKALGISAQQFLATPVDKQMNLFADSVKRLSDQGKNAAPALALISRGLAQMMPELAQGSAHMEELKQRAIETGGVVSGDTTKAMASLHETLVLLWNSMKGLGETILASLSPAIKELATAFANAAGNLSALIATGAIGPYIWSVLKEGITGVMVATVGTTKEVQEHEKAEEKLGQQLKDVTAKYREMLKAAMEAVGQTSVKVKMPGTDPEQMKLAELAFKAQSEYIENLAKTFQITEDQKTAMLRQALTDRMNAEIKAGESVKVAKEKMNQAELQDFYKQNQAMFNAVRGMADKFASDFSGALNSILDGTKSWTEAMRGMFAKMIEDMIAMVIKLIAEYLILNAVAAAFPGLGLGSTSFGALLSGALGIKPAATGTPLITQGGLAMVHAGEAIVPAQFNPFNVNGGNNVGGGAANPGASIGGGNSLSLNLSAIDGRSMMNMFFNNRQFMSQLMSLMARNNPSNVSRIATGQI